MGFQDAGETPDTADIGRYAANGDNAPTIDSIDLCGLASERQGSEVSGHIINRRSPGLRSRTSGDSAHGPGRRHPRTTW